MIGSLIAIVLSEINANISELKNLTKECQINTLNDICISEIIINS